MKVAVIGSRGLHINNIESYLPKETTELVSGGAKGIDSCIQLYADKNRIPIKVFLPEYTGITGAGAVFVLTRSSASICPPPDGFFIGCFSFVNSENSPHEQSELTSTAKKTSIAQILFFSLIFPPLLQNSLP